MKYIITYAIIVTIAFLISFKSCSNYKIDNNRLSNNQEAILTEMETYKTKNGENVAKLMQLELTNSEYEKLMSQQAAKIKEMGIKIKRLERVNITSSETETGGKVPIKDSIIYVYKDSIRYVDSVRYFEWKDTWSTISGIVTKDSVDCKYHSVDTLNIICYKVPKLLFGFIPIGTKYIETQIYNSNINTKITYAESIKLSKKRKNK